MILDLGLSLVWLGIVWISLLRYVEHRQWWTLRLKMSCWIPGWPIVLAVGGLSLSILQWLLATELAHIITGPSLLGSFVAVLSLLYFRLLLPLAEGRAYANLRWRIWSGPSRTGISPNYVRYIGGQMDWKSLVTSCDDIAIHPVERWTCVAMPFDTGIAGDPTAILKARLALDEELDTVWVPSAQVRDGLYAPVENDRPASLIWGAGLGFRPRCSRGIIAMPANYLTFQPRLKNGVDCRPLCLAHGILARNKGLSPHQLVCNLAAKGSFRMFEENSVLWPRPSKTLRSYYRQEMSRAFSGLGESYVVAATELALLLADSPYEMVHDWLDGNMEHQDLVLNNRIAELGASSEDLLRLYRGHYAAMLVSLSMHRRGQRRRPEITVFLALCALENVAQPLWMQSPEMVNLMHQEAEMLGVQGTLSVEAII